jgi:uncharacterized secreted repeat protein (TIGR03808 family)
MAQDLDEVSGRTRRAILGGGLAAIVSVRAASAQSTQGRRVVGSAPPVGLRPGLDQDQTAALQQALSAAARERKAVHLPPGRYRAGGLVLPPGTRLMGSGAGATIITQANTQPLLAARAADSIAIQDMTLEGNPAASREPLVSLADVGRLDLSGVAVLGARGIAVRLERCGGRLERSSISDADIAILSLDATGLQIVGNVVDRCANNGIQVWRSQKGYDGTQVLANRISNIRAAAGGSGQNGNGINVFRAGGVIVGQNVIRDCAFTAVRNNAGDNVQILGNSCANLGEVAIYAEFTFEGCVIANNLVDRAAIGISMTNFNENGRLAVATGNIVRNLFRRFDKATGTYAGGLGIAVEADAAVTGNVVEGAEFAGIAIGYGTYQRDVICSDNVVRRCPYGITVSVVPNSGTAQITNNILSECSRGRIVGFDYDKAASGDLAESADRRFAHLTIQGNTGR